MINDIKTWNELLAPLPEKSVLMGGAIRDWYFHKEAKDYDIYHTYKIGTQALPDNWTYLPRDWTALNAQAIHEAEYEGIDNEIGSVYDYDVHVSTGDIVRVQLIGVNLLDPRKFQKKFDHSLTLGRYGEKGLLIDRKMLDGIQNKEVYCLNTKDKFKSQVRATAAVMKIDPDGWHKWKFIGFND